MTINVRVECASGCKYDYAELRQDGGGEFWLKVNESHRGDDDDRSIVLTPETAEQLRNALTEWLEAQ